MISLVAAAALAALLPGQTVGVSGGARLESTAGQVPVIPGVPPRDIAAVEVTPSVGLALVDRRFELQLAYLPRLYFRAPNDLGRPLLLHHATLRHTQVLGPTATLELTGDLSTGEVDYSRASLIVLDAGSTNVLPQGALIKSTNIVASAELSKRFSRTDTLRVEASSFYSTPIGGSAFFLGQTRVGADVSYERGLTRVDTLILKSGFLQTHLEPPEGGASTTGPTVAALARDFSIASAQVRWRRSDERGFLLETAAGLAGAVNQRTIVPVLELRLATHVLRSGYTVLDATVGGGVEGFVSPAIGTFGPRLLGLLRFDLAIRSQLTISALGSFSSAIGAQPDMLATPLAPLESIITGRVPIIYRFSDDVRIEVGGRASARGPRFSSSSFALSQVELVGYALVDVTLATRLPPAP